MMIKPAVKQMVQIVADPGRHLSVEAGDVIALFILGGLIGSIITSAMLPKVTCWIFA